MAENTSDDIQAPLLEDILEQLLDTQNPSSAQDTEKLSHESIGKLCKTKVLYEGREKCNCCINWVEQYPQDIKDSVEETSDAKKYAIIYRVKKAHGRSKRPLELHSIIIQSPLLKSVLGEVLAGYTNVTTSLEDVVFEAPFWEFFYRWRELTEFQCKSVASDSDQGQDHVRLLLQILTTQLGDSHRIAKDLVQNGVISYDFLWTIFPPKTQVFCRLFGQDCILEVKDTRYYDFLSSKKYIIYCQYIEWNGKSFGWETKTIEIPIFSGTKRILDLEVYPITFHKAADEFQLKLVERGHRFISLSGCHHKFYKGRIKAANRSAFGPSEFARVMVDASAFAEHVGSASLDPFSESDEETQFQQLEAFSDRLLMLCSPTLKAYGLKTKIWGNISVDGISDIEWNENAFDSLVLNEDTKKLIESFVIAQTTQKLSSRFDDFVEGKGQGMILLLAGEPGVGKTLTAETVAEKARRPLYIASAGELGISCNDVEMNLSRILDLTYQWNAILLLDESDVFLEQRTSENLERNQLVSVFLRMLEYYRGMLFLTTNRLSVFDAAFQSRIHLTLNYQELNEESRCKIWNTMLERADVDSSFSKEDYDDITKEPLNGRQIKNIVKSATLLAAADNNILNMGHIKTVLQIMQREGNLQLLN